MLLIEKLLDEGKKRGLIKLFPYLLRVLYSRISRLINDTLVDKYLGVETSKIEKEDLFNDDIEHVNDAQYYEAIRWGRFKQLLKTIPINNFSDYSFVDVGSGKGRALFFADKLGFRNIVGVEMSKYLFKCSQRNLKRYKSHAKIEILCKEIRSYQFPEGNLVIYLYNPFIGKMMENFIESLRALQRDDDTDVYIVYCNPACAEAFEACDYLQTISRIKYGNVYTVIKHSI